MYALWPWRVLTIEVEDDTQIFQQVANQPPDMDDLLRMLSRGLANQARGWKLAQSLINCHRRAAQLSRL